MASDFIYFKLPKQKTIYWAETTFNHKLSPINGIENTAFVFAPFNNKYKAYTASFLKVNKLTHQTPNHAFYVTKKPNINAANYKQQVADAVKILSNTKNTLQKVVLARSTLKKMATNNVLEAFKQVCNTYQKHFCYLVTSSQFGTWIGASPEPVLTSTKKNIATTVALAGTKASAAKKWTDKEKEEQLWVQHHIKQQLQQLQLTYKAEKTRTVASGALFHLQTVFNVNLPEQTHFFKLLSLLNPTPAVAGYPVGLSIKYLKKHEQLERSFYTGLVGVINFNKQHHVYVNLRCAALYKNNIQLFAGAGITKDSNPESEHLETERKMQAIGQFFT